MRSRPCPQWRGTGHKLVIVAWPLVIVRQLERTASMANSCEVLRLKRRSNIETGRLTQGSDQSFRSLNCLNKMGRTASSNRAF